MEVVLNSLTPAILEHQPMRKLIIQLLIVILVLSGSIGYVFVNRATPASSCTIASLTTQVGNGTLSYSQVGNGRSILLLHGLFADKEQWNTMMCRLSEMGYRAIAPDLPGYGNSNGFTLSDYALENQTTLLHELMEKLRIKSFDLAGSSMGGAIAHLYAQRYPNQVRTLAFIGSPLGIVDWASSFKEAIFQGINPFIPITKEQFALEISLLFFTPPTIPDSVIAEKVNDYITRNQHYQQVWDIVNLYDDILCQGVPTQLPTFTIWGEEDKIYDISGANRLQECIAGARVIQLPKAGHLVLIENADEAASKYVEFLQTARGR
ncbi:alpha/beta fold hydrolase [Brasilonema sennae]|nr:alpha/beta hydrolase [Brasilonema sennae]